MRGVFLMIALALTVVSAVMPELLSQAHAGLFLCRDTNGSPIYTDSPAQLEHCNSVERGSVSGTGSASATTSRVDPGIPQSVPFPSPNTLSAPPPTPVAVPETNEPTPETGLPPPTSSEPVPPVAGPAPSQPCVPGVNPLNPLSGPPCLGGDLPPSLSPQPAGHSGPPDR